jgi:hypothetical protein
MTAALAYACFLCFLGAVTGQDGSCPDGYEYSGCGSACPPTCQDQTPLCLALCVPGCFCPNGLLDNDGACISPEDCPTATTPSCPDGYEYSGCGSACGSPCTTTCDNHDEPVFCTDVCNVHRHARTRPHSAWLSVFPAVSAPTDC